MKKINIILTGAGGAGGPGIIKSLKRASPNFFIIGLDNNQNSIAPAIVDKFYQVPLGNDKKYVPKLLEIVKKEKVKVILPLNTRELLNLASHIDDFEKVGVRVNISPLESLKIANNKYLLNELCKKIGVPYPKTILVKSFSAFKKAVLKSGHPKNPVCIKSPVSNGQRGFRIIDDSKDQLDLFLNQKPTQIVVSFKQIKEILKKAKPFPELMVTEYLPGEEYTVDILAQKGKALVIIPRLREEIKMGVSFRAKTVRNPRIIQYSALIVKALKLHGIVGLQFKKDKKGIPKTLEANPRLQGTNIISVASGVNLPYLAVKMLLGEKFKIPKVKWGVKMIRYWNEIFLCPVGNKMVFRMLKNKREKIDYF